METQKLAQSGQSRALDILADEPAIEEVDNYYWLAFHKLRYDQPPGMFGSGSIPWRSINDFAKRYDVEGDDFDRLEQMIRFIEVQDRRIIEAQTKKTPTK